MNKPVAWVDPRELDMDVSTTVTKNKWDKDDIPLYTHPVELTDEDAEIAFKEWEKTETFPVSSVEHHGFINGFKFAIRKAQKK